MKNESIRLLVSGKHAFPEIIQCIEHAKISVEINMFIWRDDKIGNRMAEAVLTAADRGAKVSISVDRYGVVLEKCEEGKRSFFHKQMTLSEKTKAWLLEKLYPENSRPGNVKDEYTETYKRVMTHPNITVSADKFKADHSKYYIIDDEILFVGGINIEDKENGCDISGRVYGDYMVKLCSEKYVCAFRKKLATGRNTLDELFFGVNLKNPERRFEMEQLYLNLINEAETELHITMAYFSPLATFTQAILAAHRRGVHVSIIISERANFQNDSNRRTAYTLLKASSGEIDVYFCKKMLHTKLVMNEQYISLGSTNITKKAFSQLSELNLFVQNRDTAFKHTLQESILEDMRCSRRIRSFHEITYNRLFAFLESFMV